MGYRDNVRRGLSMLFITSYLIPSTTNLNHHLGLRGAIAFALSLFTDFGDVQTRRIVITNTLVIVLFTTMALGGATLPLISASLGFIIYYPGRIRSDPIFM